jgi:hypothetical protein
MTDQGTQPDFSNLPPYKVAFVIDGEVADVLHTDERLFAIFMSNPVIVDVTQQMTANPESITVGAMYDINTGVFTVIEPEQDGEEENV